MHDVPVGTPSPAGGLPLFDIRDLCFTYADGNRALNTITLSIHQGDRIALVGHNGSGKTTLIKHLNGLLRGQSGTLLYKGEPVVADTTLSRLRLEVGILFQDPDDQLFCNTLYEDVAFGPMNQGLPEEVVSRRVKEALRAVDLEQYMYKPPHNLSYGQRKRAALATILAMNPEVLILDEPTANLDPRQVQIFGNLLRAYSGTIICINHDLLFLDGLCDRAIVMAGGRIHHDYAFADLVAHPPSLRDHGLDFSFRFSCCDDHPHAHGHTPPGHAADRPAPRPAVQPVFRLENCSYSYPDGTMALRDVSLSVNRGEKIALVGENGAGKSTLAALLLGTVEGSGKYWYEGKEMTPSARRQMWRKVGIVFQDAGDQLFCPSCREEVGFGPRQLGLDRQEIEARVSEALAMVKLSGCEERVPLNMSGGERKRLAIASVLSMRPEVLILDEPTAGLDPHGEEMLLHILRQLDMTMVLITHDLFFINALTRRTVVMHRGAVIRDYATTEFLADEHLQEINGLAYAFHNECKAAP